MAQIPPTADYPMEESDLVLGPEIKEVQQLFTRAAMKITQIRTLHRRKERLSTLESNKRDVFSTASRTHSLGLDIETYSYICDAIEMKLSKAIAVCRRDIEREEYGLKEISSAKLATQSTNQGSPDFPADLLSSSVQNTEALTRLGQPTIPQLPPHIQMGMGLAGPLNVAQLRRPSTISLASLRGPRQGIPFPLKLDLSATSLHLDDSIVPGLFSPVTLAPRTGKPPLSAVDADVDIFKRNPTNSPFPEIEPVSSGMDSVALDIARGDGSGASLDDIGPVSGNSSRIPLTLELGDTGDMESLFGDVTSAVELNGDHLPLSLEAHGDNNTLTAPSSETSLFMADEPRLPHGAGNEVSTILGSSTSMVTAPSPAALLNVLQQHNSVQNTEGPGKDMSLLLGHSKEQIQTEGRGNPGSDFDLGLDFNAFSPSLFTQLDVDSGIPGLEGDIDIMEQMLNTSPAAENADREGEQQQ